MSLKNRCLASNKTKRSQLKRYILEITLTCSSIIYDIPYAYYASKI